MHTYTTKQLERRFADNPYTVGGFLQIKEAMGVFNLRITTLVAGEPLFSNVISLDNVKKITHEPGCLVITLKHGRSYTLDLPWRNPNHEDTSDWSLETLEPDFCRILDDILAKDMISFYALFTRSREDVVSLNGTEQNKGDAQ
jgi:hypothetical protein